MAPGPADGAVVEWLGLTPPDPDRLARLLTAVGFVPSEHRPRRVFHEVGSATGITLNPIGEPEDLGPASWSMSWEEPDGPPTSLSLAIPTGERARQVLDGVAVSTRPDRRGGWAPAPWEGGGPGGRGHLPPGPACRGGP